MGYRASAADWFDLLGLTSTVNGLFAGDVTLSAARSELARARAQWPGVSDDWVAIVDALGAQFDAVQEVIQEQASALAALEESLGRAAGPDVTVPGTLPSPADRLLTAEEREVLDEVPTWFASIRATHRRRAEDAEEEAAEAEAEYEDALSDYEEALAQEDDESDPDSRFYGDDEDDPDYADDEDWDW